jgi:hypothetical protein
MASSKFNNIHRQQLFHWIGSHIEDKAGAKGLDDALREEYVACLRGALENGLWVKTPRDPDQIKDGKLVKVTLPITCFTEWSLGQSLAHTTRYGRLGLGFPKRFVLSRGGQPLVYVRDQTIKNPYTSSLLNLAQYFTDLKSGPELTTSQLDSLREHFAYIAHFAKIVKKPANRGATPKTADGISLKKTKKNATPNTAKKVPDIYTRPFGGTLHYLEEREWRIVYAPSVRSHFTKAGGKDQPDYFLPFKPGKELFTIALPDNRTINIALSDKRFKDRMLDAFYPAKSPHVTLISLQDIGTF